MGRQARKWPTALKDGSLTQVELHGVDVVGGGNLAARDRIFDTSVHNIVATIDEGERVTRARLGLRTFLGDVGP